MGLLKGVHMGSVPSSSQPTAAELLESVRAFQPACIVTAATDLDVFTALRDQPQAADALAVAIDADPRATTILLDALVALELLTKREDTYSVPPAVADLLAEGGPGSVLPAVRHLANCLRRWTQLAQVVKTGRAADRTPSIRGSVADGEAFIGAMDNFTAPIAPEVVNSMQPLEFRHLLDIGGASGTWTQAFLRAVPEGRATLFDLPEVIPMAERRVGAAGLAERVTLVGGDYNVDALPSGADFAWLSAIAHQNSRVQNQALYAKIHAALVSGGTLMIRDVVLAGSRTAPRAGALFAVNMLVATDAGNSYTLGEYRADLSEAGFTDIELIHEDAGMDSLIRARKP